MARKTQDVDNDLHKLDSAVENLQRKILQLQKDSVSAQDEIGAAFLSGLDTQALQNLTGIRSNLEATKLALESAEKKRGELHLEIQEIRRMEFVSQWQDIKNGARKQFDQVEKLIGNLQSVIETFKPELANSDGLAHKISMDDGLIWDSYRGLVRKIGLELAEWQKDIANIKQRGSGQ